MSKCKKPEHCLYKDDRCRVAEACLRSEIHKSPKPVTAAPPQDGTVQQIGNCIRRKPTTAT